MQCLCFSPISTFTSKLVFQIQIQMKKICLPFKVTHLANTNEKTNKSLLPTFLSRLFIWKQPPLKWTLGSSPPPPLPFYQLLDISSSHSGF